MTRSLLDGPGDGFDAALATPGEATPSVAPGRLSDASRATLSERIGDAAVAPWRIVGVGAPGPGEPRWNTAIKAAPYALARRRRAAFRPPGEQAIQANRPSPEQRLRL